VRNSLGILRILREIRDTRRGTLLCCSLSLSLSLVYLKRGAIALNRTNRCITLFQNAEYLRSLLGYVDASHSSRLLVSLNIQRRTCYRCTCPCRRSCINMEAKANAKSISTPIFARLLVHLTLHRGWSNRIIPSRYLGSNMFVNVARIISRSRSNIRQDFRADAIYPRLYGDFQGDR